MTEEKTDAVKETPKEAEKSENEAAVTDEKSSETDKVDDKEAEKSEKKVPDDADEEESNSEIIDRLCKYVYTKGSDRVRTRAMLCHIYHHALHDRLYEARDLMLISHLQETIQHSDIPTQVRRNLLFDF